MAINSNKVSLSLHRLIFALGLCSLLAACNPSDNGRISSNTIGSDGGSLSSSDGSLTLEIPAGALSELTQITVRRAVSSSNSLMLYEFSPAGLEFAVPARMTVDVSPILADSDASSLRANALPGIITATPTGDQVEGLENLELLINSDSNTFLLSGDVQHFSRFAVGGNFGASVSIEGVPQFWPANTAFQGVQVVVQNGPKPAALGDYERLSQIFYQDSSVTPVLFQGQAGETRLSPIPNYDRIQTYTIPYACGDSGLGTFKTKLKFQSFEFKYVQVYKPIELNIAAAFIFSPGAVSGGEYESKFQDFYREYNITGTRTVNCGGDSVVEETPEPTATPGLEPTATATPAVTPEPTAEPTAEPTVEPTTVPTTGPSAEPTATPSAPSISASSNQISINHTIGSTSCPTQGEKITIRTDSNDPLDVLISEDLDFLTVSPSSSNTQGGRVDITPSFPCSGYQVGENRGSISVQLKDPISELLSDKLTIAVTVTVR